MDSIVSNWQNRNLNHCLSKPKAWVPDHCAESHMADSCKLPPTAATLPRGGTLWVEQVEKNSKRDSFYSPGFLGFGSAFKHTVHLPWPGSPIGLGIVPIRQGRRFDPLGIGQGTYKNQPKDA